MPRERRPQSKFKGQSFFKDGEGDNSGDLKGGPASPTTKKRRPTNLQAQALCRRGAGHTAASAHHYQQASPSLPDLVPPPPLTGYGETIVASNPFDDSMPCMPPLGAPSGPHPGSHQPPTAPPILSPAVPPNVMHAKPVPMSSGKIYPADQPMVFNPQNPNAPPIYPCGICHKEVHDNDQAILCESGCNFWFHRVCTGLTEASYHLLTAEVYAEWVCDKCLNSKSIPLVKFKP